jgi:hypothetical protein
MDKIFFHEEPLIEKLAHDVAMASALARFNELHSNKEVTPTKEAGYILYLYHKYKEDALYEIRDHYELCKVLSQK